MRVVTLPRRRMEPNQSSEARPERNERWVGGIIDCGKKMVTMMAQKEMMGSWSEDTY